MRIFPRVSHYIHVRMKRVLLICVHLCASVAILTAADPYAAARSRDYPAAIAAFQDAIARQPANAALRKDLAYTLLKTGDNEEARDQFKEAMRLDPADEQAAMEYAFLCFETQQQSEARRVFSRLSNPTARQAFAGIDRPLAEGIERWRKAVELSPGNFSAHEELARLAAQRDEHALAAEHFEKAWRLKPSERSLLLDLGRAWTALGRTEDANAALLAASRGAQPRVAERAREIVPKRYPYVYEFRRALELDPANLDLRRELAYLLLAMDQKAGAETEFRHIATVAPEDILSVAQLGFLLLARKDLAAAAPLLDRVLKSDDEELADRVRAALKLPQTLRRRTETTQQKLSREAKSLAAKSLHAGYLKDALKYLNIAHENDPIDFDVMLKLGWTYNILKQDKEAVKWFNLARRSPDSAIAGEAQRAWHNLTPALARTRTTAWAFPFYSSRWHSGFAYAQVKTDFRIGSLPIRPYISTRLVGDTSGVTPQQRLSEQSAIFAIGIATRPSHGATLWFEAGQAIGYRNGSITPDYRGGLAFNRGFGRRLRAETDNDAIYVSRFQHDILLYSQNRTGFKRGPAFLYWNSNLTLDTKRQAWANTAEFGPGIRLKVSTVLLSLNALRGQYLTKEGAYYDLRAGIWYAFTH